jgi:hypothetical protein
LSRFRKLCLLVQFVVWEVSLWNGWGGNALLTAKTPLKRRFKVGLVGVGRLDSGSLATANEASLPLIFRPLLTPQAQVVF